jgi:DNA-binding MarR family transcriptional regulator
VFREAIWGMANVLCPAVNPLETRLGYRLRRVSSQMMGELARRLGALDLRPAEASILVLIDANPAITQSRIGQALGIQRANMTPLVGGLLARELIAREAINRKSHGFTLTGPGREMTSRVLALMDEHEARYFGNLSATELRILRGTLDRVALAD